MSLAYGFSMLGAVWYCAIMTISFAGWYCTHFLYNQPGEADREGEEGQLSPRLLEGFGVSILRPMSGLEPDLYHCIASSFSQVSQSPFEVILSVADPADPAVEVAKRVIAEYPEVDSTLITGDTQVGVNPKINNLVRSYEASKYPVLWILDSNTWTSSDTLTRSVTYFRDNKVNLVHHIPIAHAQSNARIGAMLDDVYMATMHAKMYSIINYLSVAPCVMGKSNLLRKSALPSDGLRSFAKYIAEDHLIAVNVWHGRNTHVLACDCVRQPLLDVSWTSYAARRIRWVRVRKYMTTAATLVEPFTECLLLGLVGACSVSPVLSTTWWKLWIIHIVLWMGLDYSSWNRLRNAPHIQSQPAAQFLASRMTFSRWITIWSLREVTALPIWCIAMISDKIAWRGSQFVINRDMTARRVD